MNNKPQLRHTFQWEGDVNVLQRPNLDYGPFLRVHEVILASAVLIVIPLSAASAP